MRHGTFAGCPVPAAKGDRRRRALCLHFGYRSAGFRNRLLPESFCIFISGSDLTDNQTNDGIIISLVALITPDNLPWVSSCKLDIWVSQNISWIQTGKRRCSHSKIILGDDDFIFTFSLYIESELLGRSNH